MNSINVFENESAFNNAKSSLSIPQLSYAKQEDKVFCLSESQPFFEFDMVDLGLSQRWGNMNAGATCGPTKESWYGGFYSWGEKFTKNSYDHSKYSLWDGHMGFPDWKVDKILKYNSADGYTTLHHDDDPGQIRASAHRSPTPALINELIDTTKINREWKTDYMGVSGLNGVLFTSKVSGYEGNSIFIPAGGIKDRNGWRDENNVVYLWSNTVDTTDYNNAYRVMIQSNDIVDVTTEWRSYGMTVREVSYFI